MNIKNDPSINNLLQRIPKNVRQSFTDEQLTHLKVAIGARQWGKHSIDCRGVVRFFKYRYYFVFLAGRNRRELNSHEKKISQFSQIVFISVVVLVFFLFLIFILYLIKSALGINIIESYSFGIWDSLKDIFK